MLNYLILQPSHLRVPAFFLSFSMFFLYHIVSVNVYPLTVLRVLSEYCPCRAIFVCLRTLGYTQPVILGMMVMFHS